MQLRPGPSIFPCVWRGLLTAAAGLALVGCGGGSSVDSGNSATTVSFENHTARLTLTAR